MEIISFKHVVSRKSIEVSIVLNNLCAYSPVIQSEHEPTFNMDFNFKHIFTVFFFFFFFFFTRHSSPVVALFLIAQQSEFLVFSL